MNTHYNNKRQTARLTSGIDKKGVLADLQKTLIPPHPVMEILLPAVSRVGKDGVDHINIDSYATTQLGKGLHPRSALRFDHPLYGPFGSVEGFWNWYGIEEKDDRLRTLMPFEMRQFMERNSFRKLNPTELRFRVMEATWIKIAGHAAMSNDMRESTLPFDLYRPCNADLGHEKTRSPVRIRPPFANWMIPAFEEIRKALKEGRKPDLFGLLTTADDRATITELATPEVREKKPKAPKVKKPAAVKVEESAEQDQATAYGNLVAEEGEVLNVTGIANPEDTLVEGGQQVQELVKEELAVTQPEASLGLIAEVSDKGDIVNLRPKTPEDKDAMFVQSSNNTAVPETGVPLSPVAAAYQNGAAIASDSGAGDERFALPA